MRCAVCDRELLKREHAQPMTVDGVRCWPRSLCDACCRGNPTPAAGSSAAEPMALEPGPAVAALMPGPLEPEPEP